jgi:hypothetical protein
VFEMMQVGFCILKFLKYFLPTIQKMMKNGNANPAYQSRFSPYKAMMFSKNVDKFILQQFLSVNYLHCKIAKGSTGYF